MAPYLDLIPRKGRGGGGGGGSGYGGDIGGFSQGEVAGIIIGSIAGAVILVLLCLAIRQYMIKPFKGNRAAKRQQSNSMNSRKTLELE